MNILLDIAGSLAIRGAIVLVILRLNVSLQQTLMLKTATANVRENLATLVSIIETDMRQAGYNVSGTAFIKADTSEVIFLADFKNNGTIDTVRYYLSDGKVYRKESTMTRTTCIGIGLTQFRFEYYDYTGAPAATLDNIRSVKLIVAMEENYTITQLSDGQSYRPSARSEHQFFPPNL